MIRRLFFPLIIFAVATALIFYQFPTLPKNLSYDEVEFAKLALSLDGKPYTPYSPLATGHSTFYFYIILFSFKIFGVTNFALRFPAALFGILNIILFYQIMKLVFKKSIIYYLLSIIFLTSRWYFNFARFSFEATFLLSLELTAIYFLFQCFKTLKWKFFALSGLFAGLAFNSYTPGRIFFLLPLISVISEEARNLAKRKFRNILLFLIPFLITIIPLSVHLYTNKDIRIDQQFFWKNSQLSLAQKIDFTRQSIKSTALMFNFKGDVNGRHNYPYKPALNPILGSLFIVGLFLTVKNIKKLSNQIFLVYFILSLIPAILTYPWENPNMLRTFTVIPSVVFFIGNVFVYILKMKNSFRRNVIFLSLLVLIFASSLYEIRTYFFYQKKVFHEEF